MRILYLENHPEFIKVIKNDFLKGHVVFDVPNVSEARAMFQSEAFDLVICDYDLDDLKGSEFVKYVRGLSKDIPI